jgi:hypothetical protein
MSRETNTATMWALLEELFEKGNLDAPDDLVHPEFVNHEARPQTPRARRG